MLFQHTHEHSSPLQQALHKQKANHHFKELENPSSVFFFEVLEYSFKVPPSHMKVPSEGCTPHQREIPPFFIPVATMGKRKQANEFQWCHHGQLTDSKFPTLISSNCSHKTGVQTHLRPQNEM